MLNVLGGFSNSPNLDRVGSKSANQAMLSSSGGNVFSFSQRVLPKKIQLSSGRMEVKYGSSGIESIWPRFFGFPPDGVTSEGKGCHGVCLQVCLGETYSGCIHQIVTTDHRAEPGDQRIDEPMLHR